MELNNYIGRKIIDVLQEIRASSRLILYEKTEGNEFVELPEDGIYFQSKNDTGIVSGFRIFLMNYEKYLSAKDNIKGRYSNLFVLEDFERRFGSPIRDIKAIKIPGSEPTFPGKAFVDNERLITAYYADNLSVAFIHIKLK